MDRWPDAICTDAISVPGEGLVEQFWAEVSDRWNCPACDGHWPGRVECKRCHGKPVKRKRATA